MKNSGGGRGEIVQVQGGHIIRATGRKDRHSKVCTAKGPRDRRMRLAAHTAIQFYDVQDRLGYDRPSKAVDWLIKKAKSAIDKLADEAPQPFAIDTHRDQNQESSLVAPLMNLDHEAMIFQSYPRDDIMSRTTNLNEDLGLSLHNHFQGNAGQASSTDQTIYSGSAALSFDENIPRLSGWNNAELTLHENKCFMVNSLQESTSVTLLNQQAMFLGHHQSPPLLWTHHHHHHHRGTLQSSFVQPFRSCSDHLSVDRQEKKQDHMDHHHHQASLFGSQGIMQGFSIPTSFHGGEAEGIGADRPSSSSSSPPDSHN